VNCGALERWLDEGMPGPGARAALAHAASCPLCGPRVRDAERLEALLAAPGPRAPAGFEDRVLARIAAEAPRRSMPARMPEAPSRLPWWSGLGADATLPLALAAASVLMGLAQTWLHLARLPIHLPLPTFDLRAALAALDATPLRTAAVAVALLPPLLLLSYALYRSADLVVRASLLRR